MSPSTEPETPRPPTIDGLADLEPLHLTDGGNAQRFARDHAGRVRYCWTWKRWLVWDGRRWKIDAGDQVATLAKATARGIYAEAWYAEDRKERRPLADHASKTESRRGLEAMLALAQSEPGIPVDAAQLDAHPWVLNVENGTLDLRTGQLRRHDPTDLLTKLAPVAFDADATAPRWQAFLERIFEGRASLIAFMQRVAGYVLTGDTSERALFVLFGSGANGKTTFLRALMDVLGDDYATKTPTRTLMLTRNDAIPNDVARLAGARLVVANESGDQHRLDEALVKDMTGGGDKISARFLHAEWFQFSPTFKLLLATNHRPSIRGTDDAVWDRLQLVPFNVRIPEPDRDPHLLDALRAELPGILAWAVRGCLEWQRQGLGTPDEVREATTAYRDEEDRLGAFLRACCVVDPATRVPFGELYAAYLEWAAAADEEPLSDRAFGQQLSRRGYAPKPTKSARVRLGLRLRDLGDERRGAESDPAGEGMAGDASWAVTLGDALSGFPPTRAREERTESDGHLASSVTRQAEPAWVRGEDGS